MALTPSTMLPLGSKAPDLQLWEPGGSMFTLGDFREVPALLVMVICNQSTNGRRLDYRPATFRWSN